MTDKIKLLSPVIWAEIQRAKNILLHCHPSPDGDSVGGVLAMSHVLKPLGKNATVIIGDSKPPQTLSSLPGFDKIQPKNYFQIDLSQFDLFIIQDSSSKGQISKLGEVNFPAHLRTVVIDHHDTNASFADINLVDPTSPAVCQMVYELFKEWKVAISPDAAACLIVGMYTDTGGFKYPATTPQTFMAAADLANINPNFSTYIFNIENSFSPEQIKFVGLSLTHIETYFSGKVALAAVSYVDLQKNGISKEDTEKIEISNMLKSVIGWELGIRFTEIEPGTVTVSMRTRDSDRYDVGKIAAATGYGGGHKVASGATLKMPYQEAKKFLLEIIKEVCPDLGEP